MTARALLVIDMVRDFVAEDGALTCGPAARRIVSAVAGRIAAARQRGDAVIYVCDRHQVGDPEFRQFAPHCLEGTPGAEIIEELRPLCGDVIVFKRRFSGFAGTDLDITLRDLGVTEITLVGVCTNICVLYTAADARSLGYGVTVPGHAVASFDDQAHGFALSELQRTLGATVE